MTHLVKERFLICKTCADSAGCATVRNRTYLHATEVLNWDFTNA